jgi:hypothetical protein
MKRTFLPILTILSMLVIPYTPTVAQNSIRLSGPNYVGVWNLKVGSAAAYELTLRPHRQIKALSG